MYTQRNEKIGYGKKGRDAENYDLILNTSRFSYDECVEIIKMYIKFIQERQ